MTVITDVDREFVEAVSRVADDVSAVHADSVDREARFPIESIEALRAIGALGAFIPRELGGLGVSLETIAAACFELGRRCGSSAMVFAMHQIKVATMVRHVDDAGDWYRSYLESVAREQRLVASVTTEIGTGGDMSRSIGPVTPAGDGMFTLEKQAPVVSYGAYADDLFTTARRAPDAEEGDQVLVLHRGDQTELEPAGTWDPLGMRGTCSPGFVLRARFSGEQVFPIPFSQVMNESMVPVTHILWSHLWLGIATDAFDRARAFVRSQARKTPGETPPSAVRLSQVMSELSSLRAEVHLALAEFVEASAEPGRGRLLEMGSILRYNNVKIVASEQAPRVCQSAMAVCGIMGFMNNSPYSVGRHLRDSLSASLMVANERLHQTNAGLLLIAKDV